MRLGFIRLVLKKLQMELLIRQIMIILQQRTILQLTAMRRCLFLPLCFGVLTACDSTVNDPVANTNDVPQAQTVAVNSTQSIEKEPEFNPELWPERAKTPSVNQDIETRVKAILAQMSIEEKVGQIIQPELKNLTPNDVREYHIGSVLNGGGTTPNNDKYATVQDWAKLAESFYQASMDDSDGKVAIPLIWGSDAIHGNNNLYGATIFPHNIGLGAANDLDLIRRVGSATAMEVVATGVDWTFGPTVAVVRDIRWGRTYESYSEDPAIVMAYASEMVKGIQGSELTPGVYQADKLVATAKHFVGDGGTTNGIDRGDTAVSESELVNIHAAGYISALDGNVMTTMASFNSWNGQKLHGSKYLLTDILKGRMGFQGFVVSDWNGHSHVPGCTVEECPASVNAGIDLLMAPDKDWKTLYANTLKNVSNGEISIERLDDAVSRLLRVKLTAGLFDAGPVLKRKHVGDLSLIGSEAHRAIAREAVRKSMVLLKNNNSILPISSKSNILLAGDAADNIGKQSGGWTISWQGTGNTNKDFPGATSIYAGLKKAVGEKGQMHFDVDGKWDQTSFSNNAKPDVAIVVYGEEPYAEWHGDIANIEYQYGTKTDLALLKSLKEQNIPVVSVFISGRPLWVNKELNASDAFVAAWLPGTEGSGVADVLIRKQDGQVNYDFQGKLSFSWPKNVNQAVLNMGGEKYDPLFAYGYGLDYTVSKQISNAFSEDNNRKASSELEEAWVFVSRSISPWEFELQDKEADAVFVNGNTAKSGADNNLQLFSIDKASQEDARQIQWSGLRPATLRLASKLPQNLSVYFERQAELRFDLKVNRGPAGNVSLFMGCVEEGCSEMLSITDYLVNVPKGEWSEVSVDLNCFADNKQAFENIISAFSISSSALLDISIANIKLVPTKGKVKATAPTYNCT